jgi:uncharacterized SAM-binding protein YcdF (DUF218 family)
MTYYDVSKMFWLLAAPTNALVLISAIAALWAVLSGSNFAAGLAAAAACMLVIGTFTPVGLALRAPLENRFPVSPPDLQAPPDGIILLAGSFRDGIYTMAELSQNYPKTRLIFSGFSATDETGKYLLEIFVRQGGDPARIYLEHRPRTTSEDALYTAAVLKPKPTERWWLVTSGLHMPRAVGCFRNAGFQVEPYVAGFKVEPYVNDEYRTASIRPFARFAPGSDALSHFDAAAKEWIGLVAYRLMGKTDALFPGL